MFTPRVYFFGGPREWLLWAGKALKEAGYDVLVSKDGEPDRKTMGRTDIIVADQGVCKRVPQEFRSKTMVFYSGKSPMETQRALFKEGFRNVTDMPFGVGEFKRAIEEFYHLLYL